MNFRVLREVLLVGVLSISSGLSVLVWTAYRFDRSPTTGEWTLPAGELAQHLGVAAIVFGVFNIIIGLPDWSRYFEKRLQKIVLDYGYLKSLSPEQLRALQRRLVKATFHSDSVDREGSFLDYFDRHLHKYLGQAYRERVRGVMTYDEDGDFFFVHDFVTYVVRESGGVIQERVIWRNDADEMARVYSVRVAIRFPEGHKRAGECVVLKTIDEKDATANRELLVDCPLTAFKRVDRLIVDVESTYRVKKSRFQHWTMPCSTRDFNLTINHPPNYDVVFASFVHNPELTKQEALPGLFHFECESWMLANSGVAWRLEDSSGLTPLRQYVTSNPLIKSQLPPAGQTRATPAGQPKATVGPSPASAIRSASPTANQVSAQSIARASSEIDTPGGIPKASL